MVAVSLTHATALSPLFSLRVTQSTTTKTTRNQPSPAWKVLRGGDEQSIEATSEETPSKLAATISIPKFSALTAAFTAFGKVYCEQMEQRPILTKSYTSGFIFGLSDYLAQKIESQQKETSSIDSTRVIASTMVGLLYFGPAAHYWYGMIFKLLPGTGLLSTLSKAFWGQAIFGPSFTCIFFATSLLQSGSFSLQNWATKIRNDLPGAWLAGAGFWPLVDFISYSIVPVMWIPLFVNICSMVWTIYLSIVANRSSKNSN